MSIHIPLELKNIFWIVLIYRSSDISLLLLKKTYWKISTIMRLIFTALHEMQTGCSDEKAVCLSVRPSVCQTCAL